MPDLETFVMKRDYDAWSNGELTPKRKRTLDGLSCDPLTGLLWWQASPPVFVCVCVVFVFVSRPPH